MILYEYDTALMTIDGSMKQEEHTRVLMNERGKFGWKLFQLLPVQGTPNQFTLLFVRETVSEDLWTRAKMLLQEAATEMHLECGENTITDSIRAFLYEVSER